MLSIFPDLLAYGLLAPFLIRLGLGAYYLALSTKELCNAPNEMKKRSDDPVWWTATIGRVLMVVFSLSVLAGAYTQIGALGLLGASIIYAYIFPKQRIVYSLLGLMATSLLLSGAGMFAFDLPL